MKYLLGGQWGKFLGAAVVFTLAASDQKDVKILELNQLFSCIEPDGTPAPCPYESRVEASEHMLTDRLVVRMRESLEAMRHDPSYTEADIERYTKAYKEELSRRFVYGGENTLHLLKPLSVL